MSFLALLDNQIAMASDIGGNGPAADFWYKSADELAMGSDSGIVMSPESAMRVSTFWKCVRWKASQYGKLPKKVYKRQIIAGHNSHREDRTHYLFNIVHKRPNPTTTSMEFFGQISMDLDKEGNFYAWIERDQLGRPLALWRLLPDAQHMRIELGTRWTGVKYEKQLWYICTDARGEQHRFYPEEILHIKGLGYDGVRGYSPVKMLMNQLGWNRATERYGAQFFRKASRPSGLVMFEHAIKDEAVRARVIANLTQTGKSAHALAMIEGGATYQKLTFDQDEAQFIETIQLQQEDICGAMEVKPHKVGIMRHMTNNNIEQQNIEAATDTIHPLCERVEQWMNLGLIPQHDEDTWFIESEMKAMYRGDMEARSKFYLVMRNLGVYSANQILLNENEEPYEGGDVRFIQLNMAPVDKVAAMDFEKGKPAKPDQGNQQEKVLAERYQQRFATAYAWVWRDAVGRIASKKKPEDRKRHASTTFYNLFVGLAQGMGVDEMPVDFITRYLEALATRAADWDAEHTVDIAVAELDRAIAAATTHLGKEDN